MKIIGFCLVVKSSSQRPDLKLLNALTRLKPWTYQLTIMMAVPHPSQGESSLLLNWA